MSKQHSLLMVEDSLSLVGIYTAYLENTPLQVEHTTTLAGASEYLDQHTPDIVLLDIELPDGSGMDLLKTIFDHKLSTEVIVMTAFGSSEMAVEAIRLGAFDFLTKPFDSSRLLVTINNALKHHELHSQVATYAALNREQYCGFIGQSLPMQSVYRTIDSLAATDATGFIVGESGTGKELAADAIHQKSKRSNKPLIALNCAAIPVELMESQLFGHIKGAFTGATTDREGIASAAHGGTLFLDELCEMSLELQKKLLRFVQTGTFQKVGSNKVEQVDVRFICATNKDPMKEVNEGRFREDLYYRLHVVPVALPPLRERGTDVLAISQSVVQAMAEKDEKDFRGLSAEVEEVFLSYDWPGNVRELQNVLQNIVVLHNADLVEAHMLPEHLVTSVASDTSHRDTSQPHRHICAETELREQAIRPLWVVEKLAIENAISVCNGQVNKAASLLEVAPSTLYRKMQNWDKQKLSN